jgi:hypothetical protein
VDDATQLSAFRIHDPYSACSAAIYIPFHVCRGHHDTGATQLIALVDQVMRKPTEMFFPVSGAMNKTPAETWRQYAPLFREYSTTSIIPELLAALAQVEGAGNPVARTYSRWRLTWNPFAIYQPASSAVGMYQMTDAAFAEARRYCIRHHTVVEDGCWLNGLYARVLPSHAIELTAVFLDRNVAAILARRPNATANQQQKQALAAMIHLCGAASPLLCAVASI